MKAKLILFLSSFFKPFFSQSESWVRGYKSNRFARVSAGSVFAANADNIEFD